MKTTLVLIVGIAALYLLTKKQAPEALKGSEKILISPSRTPVYAPQRDLSGGTIYGDMGITAAEVVSESDGDQPLSARILN